MPGKTGRGTAPPSSAARTCRAKAASWAASAASGRFAANWGKIESREPLADWCPRRSEQAGSSPIFRGGQPYFGRNAKISSMVRIVLKRPFCLGFARIFGKMQDEMQDKREPACPHGNWAGADQPASRSRKMRDLSPILRTNSRKYSVLYNPQLFSGDGSFTIPMPKRRT